MVYHGSFSLFTKRGLWAIGGLVALGWAFVGNAAETTVSPAVRRSATHDRSVPTARPMRIAQVSPRGATVLRVPNLIGLSLSRARQAALAAGLRLAVGPSVRSRTSPRGLVVRQGLPAGAAVKRGTVITVALSAGPRPPVDHLSLVSVPNFVGKTLEAARQEAGADLKIRVGARVAHKSAPNTIVSQDLPEGTEVKKGTQISVIISKGPAPQNHTSPVAVTVTVPNLVGRTLDEARQAVGTNLRLRVGRRVYHRTYPRGSVIAQNLPAELVVKKGQSITVTVSLGPPPSPPPASVPVPNLVGRTLDEARHVALAAGFRMAVRRRVAHRTAPRDTILAQDPPGGVKVRKGQIIRVTISAGSSRASGGAPDRAGRSLAQAPEAAAAAGSRLVARPGGTVVAQDPPPGAQVKRGQVIRVIILDADEGSTVSVPNLVGKTLAQARQATSSAGLQLAVTWPRVAVVEQRSPRGADFSKGEAVRVTVSPEGQRPSEVGRTTTQPLVEGAAAPLMIHVLGAYGRSSDAAVQHLRRGGWEFTEIAAAGYMARRAHPRRSLEEIAQAYETRRDWTALAEQFHALPPGDAEGILRLAVENYYILRAGTARELEARGWTLEEILVAGNLDHRSEAGFDEIVRLRNAGLDWPAIAARVRVPMEQLYQPHSRR